MKLLEFAVIMLLLMGPISLLIGFWSRAKKQTMADMPTSKIRSAAMGRVELKGRAEPRAPVRTPISRRKCCWWRCFVEQRKRLGKERHWRRIKAVSWPGFSISMT